ncbi:MAG: hypothetical protein IJZ73_06055 [Clostridia bacterium]|nr:hypothetical protein [Clostridia bacterium]
MKKLKYVLMLAIIGILSIGIGFGCSKTPPTPPTPPVTVEGFTVKPSITVDFAFGEDSALVFTYDFIEDITVITDSLGNEYDAEDLTIKVLDSENQEVELNGYFFTATDVNGYTVRFTLTTLDGSVFVEEGDVLIRTESNALVNGIRSDATLDLGITNVTDIKVYQYILKDNGSNLTLKDVNGEDFTIKAVQEDVTDLYASAVNKTSGIVDTTVFDGIYRIDAISDLSKKHVYFEQKQNDTFVWNNVAKKGSVGLAGFWADGLINKPGTVEVVNSFDPIVAGRDGNYFSYTSTFEDADATIGYGFNLKLYPVHTKEYYESFGAAKVIMDFYYTFDESTTDIGAKVFRTGEGFYELRGNNTLDCPNMWSSGTASNREDTHAFDLTLLLEKWDTILRTDGLGGGFIGYLGGPDNISSYNGKFTAYFGNLHIVGDKTYKIEHYFENETTGEYDLISFEEITADENITANYVQLADTIGYEFYSEHADSVLSGVNDGSLVLKGYYRISGSSDENKGVIYDDSFNFNGLAYNTFTLKQYVIRADGDVDLGDGVKGVAVDVTSAYANIVDFNEGVVDLSKLDGVFALTVSNGSRDYTITFERIVKGVITWNNVANVAGAGVSGLYENTAYNGNGTLGVADASALNNNHKYYDENTNYFVFTSNFAGEKTSVSGQNGFNLKLYPVHTKAYYQAILDTTDVTFLMRYYIALNDAGAPSNDQFSFYANMGYNDLNQVTYDDINCWGNDVSDADVTSRFRTGTITLSQLLANWDNVISADMGGGFLGYSELDTNSSYEGSFSVYFGNLMAISNAQYKIEKYFEYPDGIGYYYLSDTSPVYAYAPYGELVEFAPESFVDYRFAENHADNVLSGVNDGTLVLKVYYEYYLENTNYTVNVYLENDAGEFVLDKGYSYVTSGPFMQTVSYTPITILGYTYDEDHDGAVVSGLNRYQLVLNVYYERDPEWTLTQQVLGGVQTADTLQLEANNIEEITITQYVLRDGGSQLTLKKANGDDYTVNAYAIDVTDTYKNFVNLETGLVDTSSLSGIFTITVIGNKVRQEVTFEQGKLDEFVWNNLDVVNSYNIRDKWSDNYNGTGTFGAADSSDSILAGRDGNYFLFNGDSADGRHWGLKVYPVHSIEYYKAILAINGDYEFAFDFYYKAEGYTSTNSDFINFHSHIYPGESQARINTLPAETWNSSTSVSLQTFVDNWQFATSSKVSSTGYFLGMRNLNVTGKYSVYFGNFRLTKASYTVEYYLDGNLDETYSENIVANLGAQVSVTEMPYIQGYEYDSANANNVLSGVNNGTLKLKLYYNAVNENVIYINGVNTSSTIDLGITNIENVSITQYVVKANGSDLVLKGANGNDFTIKASGIDVSSTYTSAINLETGIVDTTNLDGIFCIKAGSGVNRATVYVEQAHDGVFVWNNIKESGDTFVGADFTGVYGASPYTGNATLTMIDGDDDAMIEGKEGLYYKTVINKGNAGTENTAPGVRIYPVHTSSYYTTYWYNADVDVSFYYAGDDTASNEYMWIKVGAYMNDETAVSDGSNYMHNKDGQWLTRSFTINESAYNRAITNDGGYLGRIIQTFRNVDGIKTENFVLYFGGITSSDNQSQYKVEVYTNKTGEFVEDETLSYYVTAPYNENVTFVPVEFEKHTYLAGQTGEVVSGVNDGTLVLKVYYKYFEENEVVYLNGVRFDSSLDLGLRNIASVSVKQYIVKPTTSTLTIKDTNGEDFTVNAEAVDVTSTYSSYIDKATGIVDTSKFDGIYCLNADTDTKRVTVFFEQAVMDVFTWNNIKETGSNFIGAEYTGAYGTSNYTGDGVLSIVDSSSDALLEGKTGLYWKSESSMPTHGVETEAPGIRVYPVHTFNYYDSYWHNATVSVNFMYIGDDVAGNESIRAKAGLYMDDANYIVIDDSSTYKWKKDNTWLTETFVIDSNAYARATTNNTEYGRLLQMGRQTNEMLGENLTVYVGGLTSAQMQTAYKVEIYTNSTGDYAVDETLSYYATGVYNETVSIVPNEIYTYIYQAGYEGEVLSGVNDGDLILKVYYAKDPYTRSFQTIEGLRSESTLQLPFDTVDSFTLKQYVIRQDGDDLTILNKYGLQETLKVKSVDVTTTYADVVDKTTGIVNTAALDGLFTLTAISGNLMHTVTFEQYVENQFTWNNIVAENAAATTTAYVGCYGDTAYTGDGVASVETSATDAVLDGMTGTYWKSVSSAPTNNVDAETVGLRVFPVHTFEYYSRKWHDATVTVNFYYAGDETVGNEHIYIHGGVYLDVDANVSSISGAYKWKGDNKWHSSTFTLNSTAYSRAIASTGVLGRLVGTYRSYELKGDNLTIYVGGLTAVADADYGVLAGKKISVLGDSVSSYQGYSNNAVNFNSTIAQNNAGYGSVGYGGDLTSVNDTWWMQTINNVGADLLVNNSSGGARVGLDRSDIYGPAAYRDVRALELHDDTNPLDPADEDYVVDPDIIMVYMGFNDLNTQWYTVGTFEDINFDSLITDNGDGTYTYAEPTCFAEAYAVMMHKIITRYSTADLFVGNMPAGAFWVDSDPSAYNDAIEKLANKFGATVIDFNSTELSGTGYTTYTFDGIHPKATGMTIMANKATETLLAKYSTQE